MPGGRAYYNAWSTTNGLYFFGGKGLAKYMGIGLQNDWWQFKFNPYCYESSCYTSFTYLRGSLSGNAYSYYGDIFTPSPDTVPGGRFGATTFRYSDATSDYLCVFGGTAYPDASKSGSYPVGPVAELFCYSTADDDIVYRGGKGMSDTNSQMFYTVNDWPGQRTFAYGWSVLNKDNSYNFYLLGGRVENYQYNPFVLWEYSIEIGYWRRVTNEVNNVQGEYENEQISLNYPGAREYSSSFVMDDNLYLFGGFGYSSVVNVGGLNDIFYRATNDSIIDSEAWYFFKITDISDQDVIPHLEVNNPGRLSTVLNSPRLVLYIPNRQGIEAVKVGRKVYFFGGEDSVNNFYQDVWYLEIPYKCNNVFYDDPLVCSGHGECMEDNRQCNCYGDYNGEYTGETCEISPYTIPALLEAILSNSWWIFFVVIALGCVICGILIILLLIIVSVCCEASKKERKVSKLKIKDETMKIENEVMKVDDEETTNSPETVTFGVPPKKNNNEQDVFVPNFEQDPFEEPAPVVYNQHQQMNVVGKDVNVPTIELDDLKNYNSAYY